MPAPTRSGSSARPAAAPRSAEGQSGRITAGQLLDRLTYIGGALLPLFTVPQAAQIWLEGATDGVSLTTWTAYLVVSALFVVHGLRHGQALLLVTYVPFVVIEAVIIAGVLAA